MPASATIELLIIDPSRDDTELRISTLRNAGLAVHAKRVDTAAALVGALDSRDFDIVLYACGDENIALSDAYKICEQARQDLPFIVLHQDEVANEEEVTTNEKIRDVILKHDLQRIQRVVKRELHDLRIRQQLKDLKRQLQESERRCASLIENSQNAIAYIHEGMHIGANAAYLGMFGNLDVEDIEGLPILNMVAPSDHKRFKAFLRRLPEKSGVSELDVKCQSSSGNAFDARMEFSNASIDDEPCTQIIIRDQSRTNELEEKIEILSLQDSQTGLHNRSFFSKKLEQAAEHFQEPNGACSLLYISIDQFQAIQNTAGIAAGDAILKTVADILSQTVGEDEVLARFGEHSFTILSQCSKKAEAEAIAGSICKALDRAFKGQSRYDINPTCSIGIACSEGETSIQDFIDHAYFSCEIARGNGGNQFAVYDPNAALPGYEDDASLDRGQEGSTAQKQEEVEEAVIDARGVVKEALANGQMRLVYQPIVSLQGDSRENYSVMVRLLDSHGGEIDAGTVFDKAEVSELMVDVDRWVVKHAIRELTRQRKEGRKINLFVTISSASIVDPSTLLMVCDSLREAQAKGAWLTFQIREADLRAHTQEAKNLVKGLKKIKCQIAVTHFGLAPKPEAILKRLPIDFVKLDASFLKDLATQQKKQDDLAEINANIQDHGIKTIATAVEDANSLAVLWTVGINCIQGYFFQEPSETIAFDFGST